MKIYTRTGDKGTTELLLGGRVPKNSARVEAYGTLDELNSMIGYIRSLNEDTEVEKALSHIQPRLHVLCSDVASVVDESPIQSKIPRIAEGEDVFLEQEIDRFDKDLEPLTNFILPGGSVVGASLHLARTVCRRAERCIVDVIETEGGVNPDALKYVNRLADYLFALARWANQRAGHPEEIWVGKDHVS